MQLEITSVAFDYRVQSAENVLNWRAGEMSKELNETECEVDEH